MRLNGIGTEQLAPADIQSLKDNAVPEGKTVDYKLVLPGGSDKDKQELCADVASFANTAGGHLVFGVGEAGGVPASIPGCSGVDPDKEQLRIEQILRSGVEPRLSGLAFKWIDMPGAGKVLALGIERGWQTPHMVTHGGVSRFYARHTNGRFVMDVGEIRAAVLQTENGRSSFTRWRGDRLATLLANDGPVRLPAEHGKIVLHVVPFASTAAGFGVDLHAIHGRHDISRPIRASGFGDRYNADGVISYSASRSEECEGYIQYFRDGRVEIVDASMLRLARDRVDRDQVFRNIPSGIFESEIIGAVSRLMSVYAVLGISAPFAVMLSVVEARGFSMFVDHFQRVDDAKPIDRDVLVFPDFVWEEAPASPVIALRPIFDLLWNACGYARSLNYDANGAWIGGR